MAFDKNTLSLISPLISTQETLVIVVEFRFFVLVGRRTYESLPKLVPAGTWTDSYEQLWLEQGNEKTKHTFEIARMEDDLKKMFRSLQLTDTKRQISHHCSPS